VVPRSRKRARFPAQLEHRAEKWEPVFGNQRCDNKELQQAG
jgi:hypothetical protein